MLQRARRPYVPICGSGAIVELDRAMLAPYARVGVRKGSPLSPSLRREGRTNDPSLRIMFVAADYRVATETLSSSLATMAVLTARGHGTRLALLSSIADAA